MSGPFNAEQVVLVDALITQQVVLVDIVERQGIPGPQGEPGPEGPEGPVGQLPVPDPTDLGKSMVVRDVGSGPEWVEDRLTPADIHTLGALAVLDQVNTPQIVDASVTTTKLADGAVITAKLADGSVITAKLVDASVTAPKLAPGAAAANLGFTPVNPSALGALAYLNTVNTPQIVDGAVTTPKIATGAVTGPQIAAQAVGTNQIANAALQSQHFGASSVTTNAIAPLAVTTGTINTGAVTGPKLAAGAAVGNIGYTPANKAGDTFTGTITAPTVAVGDASMNFQTDATTSYLYLNGPACRLQYTKATGRLDYVVNSLIVFKVDLNGNVTTPSSVICGEVDVGAGGAMKLQNDGTYPTLFFDQANSYLQYNVSNQNLYYVRGGTIRLTIYSNSDALFAGNISAPNFTASAGINGANIAASNNMSAGNNFNCPSINLSTRMWLTANANQSYIFFDTAGGNQSYMVWDYNSTNWSYVSGGAARLTIAYGGQATFANGLQVNGTFGCGAQGFFSGNLSAPINGGIAANCVMVGYFVSGSWFNMQSVAVNVNGVAVTAGYGSGSSVNWSVSASDRRLKDNIKRPSLDPVDVVRKLPIWSCDYIAPRPNDADLDDPEAWPRVREHWPFSFMADEVDAAMPCATIKNDDGRPVALHPQHLIATLWAAVQQLTDRLEGAEAKLAARGSA